MDIQKSKYILPNLFTITNAVLGLIAVAWASTGDEWHLKAAAVAILMAMLADMMDGRVARLTRTQSRFGVQLDSLADGVSFGMAPAAVALLYGLSGIDLWGIPVGFIAAGMFLTGGLLRLARFNITSGEKRKPSPYFEGMPIPAAASVVVTLIWVALDVGFPKESVSILLAVVMPVLALLMVSRVRYYSFKDIKAGFETRVAILFIGMFSVIVALLTRASYVFLGVAFSYALVGPVKELRSLARRLAGARDSELKEL